MRPLIVLATLLAALWVGPGCTGSRRPPIRPGQTAVSLPAVQLSPVSFGNSVSLAQRLTLSIEGDTGGPRVLEALVEVDEAELRLAGFAFGQPVLRLVWDGTTLQEHRVPQLPSALQSAQVLRDVQLVYWPAEAVRAALPPGWTLEDSPGRRILSSNGKEWVTIGYDGAPRWNGKTELHNRAEHYRLTIESRLND